MEEARRFLRYTLPGLVFAVELAIYLYFTLGHASFMAQVGSLPGGGVGSGIGLFLLSGGLGYVFSLVHFALYWTLYRWWVARDYRPLLRALARRGWLAARRWDDGTEFDLDDLSLEGGWRAHVAICLERKLCSKRMEGARGGFDRLGDFANGCGASFVGSAAAIVCYVFIAGSIGASANIWVVGVACAVAAIHFLNFLVTNAHCRAVNEIVVADELRAYQQQDAEGRPYVLALGERERSGYWLDRVRDLIPW